MKKQFIAAIVLGALVAFSPSAQAQEKKDEPKGKGKGPSVEERVKVFTETLQLTEEQKLKVAAILKEQADKIRALPQEERRAKIQEDQKNLVAKIKAVLTSEQAEKYDKMLAEQAAKRKKQ